ncbi:MAG: methyl-accepting chemotaxis protein [Alphaproteobacteria bacterium]|nr:methyl-accepting chemotaxis protein [Alphaproteobacteria bacterium]MBT4965867.1 methyl-accepting chemotaxis protein [Alphaproteobacteria bacterium]MBT5158794.1 methyl-accepting chemotaxis protein [Alphaproteobacteria bacterium]
MFWFKKDNNATELPILASDIDLEVEIAKVSAVAKAVANGNFEARVTRINDASPLAALMHDLNNMIDRTDAYVRESMACMEHVERNQYWRQIIETGMVGSYATASKTVNSALGAMERKVQDFTIVADNFEETVKQVVETVSSAATELTASSEAMESIAGNTSDKAVIVAAAAEETSANVGTVAAASEELTSSIGEISQQIANVAVTTRSATEQSETVSTQVSALNEAAEKIKNAVGLINDIADQTNLLALNATIEAARAGDAGKGFAVVASEVKALAQQTSKVTEEIGGFVNGIEDAMQETIGGISEITKMVVKVDEATTSVSAAVEEQSAATNEISRNIDQASAGTAEVTSNISEVTESAQETGKSAAEVNGAANELSLQSENLRVTVDKFLDQVRKVV